MTKYLKSVAYGIAGSMLLFGLMPIFALMVFVAGFLGVINENEGKEE